MTPPGKTSDRNRMKGALTSAVEKMRATIEGPDVWGRGGRTLAARVRAQGLGMCWLRIVDSLSEEASGDFWEGNHEASRLFDGQVNKPPVFKMVFCTEGRYTYRAELAAYVEETFLSDTVTLRPNTRIPPESWWTSLSKDLSVIAGTATDRLQVRSWLVNRQRRLLDLPVLRITEWETAHGSLHPAHLTRVTPHLMGWENFGRAPLGYDAATLLVHSLPDPDFAARVRENFPVLSTDAGRTAQLVVITNLLYAATRGTPVEGVPALRKLAAEIT